MPSGADVDFDFDFDFDFDLLLEDFDFDLLDDDFDLLDEGFLVVFLDDVFFFCALVVLTIPGAMTNARAVVITMARKCFRFMSGDPFAIGPFFSQEVKASMPGNTAFHRFLNTERKLIRIQLINVDQSKCPNH